MQSHGQQKKPQQTLDAGYQALVVLDAQADELARAIYECAPDIHHGVKYLAGQGLALVFNNEPPAEDPKGRARDLAAFRRRLLAEGLHEVASRIYPRRTTSKGHTMVFLIRATKRQVSAIKSWLGSVMRTPEFREFCHQACLANGIPWEGDDTPASAVLPDSTMTGASTPSIVGGDVPTA